MPSSQPHRQFSQSGKNFLGKFSLLTKNSTFLQSTSTMRRRARSFPLRLRCRKLHFTALPLVFAVLVALLVAPLRHIFLRSSPLVCEVPASSDDNSLDIYHSWEVFRLNYADMEKNFKVYIYPDGDPNTYYHTPSKLTGKYASEGFFFQNIRESRFRTDDPDEAHLFFIPISCQKMREKGNSYENMTTIVQNYVQSLRSKYPYWNRTLGADHFFVTCHDIGVRATEGLPHLVKNSIRVVCSPSYDTGFIPHKDVSLPQVLQPFAHPAGGNDTANRKTLGFWAGLCNSKIRSTLASAWENDTELDIQNNRIDKAAGHLVYQNKFYTTKFCICPGGSQVNSCRLADSIHYGCVPVIMSDYYDLPFNDILDWQKFSVILNERDVNRLKYILKKIRQSEFIKLHYNLLKVQKHFKWNTPPVRFDAFYMVMYDLWLRRHVVKY